MRALSVHQPFAQLIAQGDKRIEVRSWKTHHRGPLWIAATRTDLRVDRAQPLPLGALVCLVDLVECRPLRPSDRAAACLEPDEMPASGFAWVLSNPRPVLDHIPVKGRQGLYSLDLDPEE